MKTADAGPRRSRRRRAAPRSCLPCRWRDPLRGARPDRADRRLPAGPVVRVLERPSAWDRSVRATVTGDGSKLTRFRREFWTSYAERHPGDGVAAGYAAASFWIWIESAELNLSPYLAQRRCRVALRGRHVTSPLARDALQGHEPSPDGIETTRTDLATAVPRLPGSGARPARTAPGPGSRTPRGWRRRTPRTRRDRDAPRRTGR